MPPPVEPREYEPCPISGKEIEHPLSAIAYKDGGQPADFSAVIQRIKDSHPLQENQKIVYVGGGAFAIWGSYTDEDGKKRIGVIERIQYEDPKEKPQWRRELSPGISRDYKPEPQPISELYTTEELRNFPKLGAAASAYMPR